MILPIAFPRHRLALAIGCLLLASPLLAFPPGSQTQNVDLRDLGDRGFRITGINAADFAGRSVSGAGDVNGDGLADVIVGADLRDTRGNTNAGESYVVFGKRDGAPADLSNLGTGGFRIEGIDVEDRSGFSVAGAGDVNGDGLADLIVGAYGADPNGVSGSGESYVVFGKADSATVDLANLGAGGFRIEGIDANDRSGFSVSGVGDFNGDGLSDLIIGAPGADPGILAGGEACVVFGKTTSTTVDLENLGSEGVCIHAANAYDMLGVSVSGAGDVNGDGLADLIVGAIGASPGGMSYAGTSYVVFGRDETTPINLANLGAGGFLIEGRGIQDLSGYSVSGAGDVNGDGLADVIVGASWANSYAGESYVVFGKTDTSTVRLANLGPGGFRISGADAGDYAGQSVAGAGDVNGDGLADVIIGAYAADARGEADAGESYVVYGKADALPVDLADLRAGGFRIDGANVGDWSGFSVSGAGDVNGDGLADLVLGAPAANIDGLSFTGQAYVVFSTTAPPSSAVYRARSANGNPPRTAFGITGNGSNDSTPDGRAWIDFEDGSDLLGSAASTEVVTLMRSAGTLPTPGANVSWRVQTTRQDWAIAEIRLRYLDSELIANENALEIVFSPNGQAPFTSLASTLNPLENTITGSITQAGFYYLGQRELPPEIFADGFEASQP